MLFNELLKNESVLRALSDENIIYPTEIQQKAIPIGIDGKDIIAKSQTGTGKTLAFMLPILNKISEQKTVQALILCPTRELSKQVFSEVRKYIKYMDEINVCTVYGGQRIDEQIKSLKKRPQIIIATPGRLIDHFRRGTIKPFAIETVVLDEADEMISIGFKEELETILDYLPSTRQTMFYSATFPKKVVDLSKAYLNKPVKIEQSVVEETIDTISQYYLDVNEANKLEVLKRLIFVNKGLSIVFCNTKKKVDETVASLQSYGIIADAIHGDLNQMLRDNVMRKMRSGVLEVLVATDVAARGIDIAELEYVYNYDFPDDNEYYVHRIGRTGRAGKTGASYTFITRKQKYRLTALTRHTKADIVRIDIPSEKEVNSKRITRYLENLKFNDVTKSDIFDNLISQGYSYEDICYAIIDDKFSFNDFEEITDRSKKSKSKSSSDRNDRNERGGRNERRRGSKQKSDTTRLFINVGRKDEIKVKHIIGAFKNQANVPDSSISDVEIKDSFSFISIKTRDVAKIDLVEYIKDYKVNIEEAKKK